MLPRSRALSLDNQSSTSNQSLASCASHLPEEWTRTGSFMNKPLRGWLHSDQKITESGICYGVRYIGCLEVNTSMKSLDFDTRSLVAKECINRLCETAGLKTADKKRKVDKRLARMIAEKPNMDYAGSNVSLTVTSSCLKLTAMESGEIIASHEMPNISFASGGDADTLDFVSYVAKDHRYGRACFVLECGGGLAEDVITTIGQAFELRYKQFLKRTPSLTSENDNGSISSHVTLHNGNINLLRDDPEYYNDLPGKVPPDVINDTDTAMSTISKGNNQQGKGKADMNDNLVSEVATQDKPPIKNEVPESLIDFATDIPNVCIYRKPEPEYVNTTAVIFNERLMNSTVPRNKPASNEIFDMHPLSNSLSGLCSNEVTASMSQPFASSVKEKPLSTGAILQPIGNSILLNSESNASLGGASLNTVMNIESSNTALSSILQNVRTSLIGEPWFHGSISRKESEALVTRDGDFLVRESQGSPGQYVLTGMQNSQRKHLLLVDPEGAIRTKDKVFESISHLISYHMDNSLPIISAESALLLRTPVCKLRPIGKPIQV